VGAWDDSRRIGYENIDAAGLSTQHVLGMDVFEMVHPELRVPWVCSLDERLFWGSPFG
jgi:hypothetical protein